MESKFLKICESLRKKINEQNNQLDPANPQSQVSEPSTSTEVSPVNDQQNNDINLSDKNSSLIPVATNEEIVKLIQSIKDFYADDKKLKDTDIEELKSLDLTINDKNIKDIISKLITKFSPTIIDTNPENIKDSRYN